MNRSLFLVFSHAEEKASSAQTEDHMEQRRRRRHPTAKEEIDGGDVLPVTELAALRLLIKYVRVFKSLGSCFVVLRFTYNKIQPSSLSTLT